MGDIGEQEKNGFSANAINYVAKKLSKVNNFITKKKIRTVSTRNDKRVSKLKILPIKSKIKFRAFLFDNMQVLSYNEEGTKTIVFLHGGAFVSEPVVQHFTFAEELCENTDCNCYMLIYPLLPYSCAKMCVQKVASFVKSLNKKVVLVGDSAGGGLAFSVQKYLIDSGIDVVEKIVGISPWLDVSMDNPKMDNCSKDVLLDREYLRYLGKLWAYQEDVGSALCSPKNIKDIHTKALLISGDDEMLKVDIEDFYLLHKDSCKWLNYLNMQHDFIFYPLKEAKMAKKEIFDFINEG